MTTNWSDIDFSSVDSPALIIDADKVEYNIQLAIQMTGGAARLRPHVKTHKMLEVAKMQLAAGISKFKCATIAEAEMLGMAGAKDVLIAYAAVGPKIKRLLQLIQKYPETQYSILIDQIDNTRLLNTFFQQAETRINVFIDINNGQNRTGIGLEKAKALVEACGSLTQINLIGLHCYDGHIVQPDLAERSLACRQAFEAVLNFQKELASLLQKEVVVVAGGSPSFSVHAKHHEVECSPGTFIFWDQRYASNYQEQAFKKAAVLITRVISQMDAHHYCLDLGHKSVASEFPFPRVAFLHPEALTQIGHSEEHLVIESEQANALQVGQLLLAFPYHICPTVALHEHVQIVRSGKLVDQWAVIARKRTITI